MQKIHWSKNILPSENLSQTILKIQRNLLESEKMCSEHSFSDDF